MKEIKVMMPISIEVTDEEWKTLMNSAYNPHQLDCAYNNISIPDWLLDKIKANHNICGDGYIMKESWIDNRHLWSIF